MSVTESLDLLGHFGTTSKGQWLLLGIPLGHKECPDACWESVGELNGFFNSETRAEHLKDSLAHGVGSMGGLDVGNISGRFQEFVEITLYVLVFSGYRKAPNKRGTEHDDVAQQ
eukprot:scaffold6661_cov109-Cylindrotheca_fusiformis.AAC.10